MLQHWCFIFQHIVQVRSNTCPVCEQASECPMQRTLLAAVQTTTERRIRAILNKLEYLRFK